MESLDFNFLVGHITLDVGLHAFLAHVIGPCAPTQRGNFLFLFCNKQGKNPHPQSPRLAFQRL